MPYYRITLTFTSPLGTKLVSGTVWGHLAWAVRYLEGETALKNWLAEQEAEPWLISSQMPAGMLPRPLLKPALDREEPSSLKTMKNEKKAKKIAYITEDIFLGLRDQMSAETLTQRLQKDLAEQSKSIDARSLGLKAHNHINRLSGTTPEAGGLFFEEVLFPTAGSPSQFFFFSQEPCLDRLKDLLDFIAENGFGSNASTGNGHFTYSIEEELKLFMGQGNRFMSLSHGVVSGNMQKARYKQHVHFGKLGGSYAKGAYSPFKYPLLMAHPGTTFEASGPGPYGALLRGVHHDPNLAEIRHHALHLTIAYTEVEP